MLINEITEKQGRTRGPRNKKYRDGGTPVWFDKAVQLKTDNPRMTAAEIGRQLKIHLTTVLAWLAGVPDSKGNIVNDNPPFTQKDFPNDSGRKYFDGEKPWWYEEAIKLRKQGMAWHAIANKFSTPEGKIESTVISNWLVKGRKYVSGTLINKDAPFASGPYNTKKIDTVLIKELIVDRYTDDQIVELIADEKGEKIARQVRTMLPVLRQKLQPDTKMYDKTKTGTGPAQEITL